MGTCLISDHLRHIPAPQRGPTTISHLVLPCKSWVLTTKKKLAAQNLQVQVQNAGSATLNGRTALALQQSYGFRRLCRGACALRPPRHARQAEAWEVREGVVRRTRHNDSPPRRRIRETPQAYGRAVRKSEKRRRRRHTCAHGPRRPGEGARRAPTRSNVYSV